MASRQPVYVYDQEIRQGDEDSISILTSVESSRPGQTEKSSDASNTHRNSSIDDTPSYHPPQMGYSVFGNNTVSSELYQEQVAWANCTQFGTPAPAVAGPQMMQTTYFRKADVTPSPSRDYFRLPRHMLEPWVTGFWLRFPWWGFGAIFLILLLTGGSTSILLISHGTSPEAWKIGNDDAQPQIYLSVLDMIINLLMFVALAEGMVIRFWRQLLHGTTLSCVHDTYDSIHLWSAVKRVFRFRFNMVAVSCILASTSFARGPLFQRALTLTEAGRRNIGGSMYHTSPLLVALGITVSVVGVVAILPLYYGFWELGRKVTLNPLEIARAFGAPIMDGLDGNTTAEMIAVERGDINLRYGALDRFGQQKQLRVQLTAECNVRTPWDGEIFG